MLPEMERIRLTIPAYGRLMGTLSLKSTVYVLKISQMVIDIERLCALLRSQGIECKVAGSKRKFLVFYLSSIYNRKIRVLVFRSGTFQIFGCIDKDELMNVISQIESILATDPTVIGVRKREK